MAYSSDIRPHSSPTDSHPEKRPLQAGPSYPQTERGPRSPLTVIVLIGACGLLIAIFVAIHSRRSAEAGLKKAASQAAVLDVSIVHPSPIVAAEEITLPGSAQAFAETPIYARTSGYLVGWKADIGEHVKQGQVLAEIETPEVDQQLEQARGDLKNAQANLEMSQLTSGRSETLFKKSTISSQERDQAVTDTTSKRALVDSAAANVRRLEQMKAFEKVTAPYDGVITARNTDIGALIQAGNATGARELFHLADNHILRVYFSVPEAYAAGIKSGETASVSFDAFPQEKFDGVLVRNASALDPRSHTLMVEADVENSSGRLFVGGYATVHLKLPSTHGAVMIPANTILFRAEGTRVALVRDGHVALVPINIGRDHGNTIEVLGSLTPADSVIIDPPDSLAEGAAVQVEDASKAGSKDSPP